jgi:hypothetical protein
MCLSLIDSGPALLKNDCFCTLQYAKMSLFVLIQNFEQGTKII